MAKRNNPGCTCCGCGAFVVDVVDSCTGFPVYGCTVTATQGATAVSITTSSLAGGSTLTIPTCGTWSIVISHAGYVTVTTSATATGSVVGLPTVHFQSSSGGATITATVTGCSGAPLVGATVTASQAGQADVVGTTPSSGTLVLPVPTAGSWSVVATKPPRFTASSAHVVTAVCNSNVSTSIPMAGNVAPGYRCAPGCADPLLETLHLGTGEALVYDATAGGWVGCITATVTSVAADCVTPATFSTGVRVVFKGSSGIGFSGPFRCSTDFRIAPATCPVPDPGLAGIGGIGPTHTTVQCSPPLFTFSGITAPFNPSPGNADNGKWIGPADVITVME